MPDGAGTHEANWRVTELVIALSHDVSVTVQFNLYLVLEHPISFRCVLCANALCLGLWKYAPLMVTLILTEDSFLKKT